MVKYQLVVLEKQNVVYYYFFKTGEQGQAPALGEQMGLICAPKQRGPRGRITVVGLPLLPADQLHRRQHHYSLLVVSDRNNRTEPFSFFTSRLKLRTSGEWRDVLQVGVLAVGSWNSVCCFAISVKCKCVSEFKPGL